MKLGVLCYIYSGNHVLFLHRNKRKEDPLYGYWIGLGGKLDIAEGETPIDAVLREVREESGLKIRPRFRGIVVFHHVNSVIDTWYGYLFSARHASTSLKETHEGELVWVTHNAFHKLKLLPGDEKLLEYLHTHKKPFIARFKNNAKKLISYSFQNL